MQRLTLSQRIALFAIPALLITANGCKREYDSPPVRTIPTGSVITVAQLRALYTGTPVHFSDSTNAVNTVYAVVTADEQNGNLYKNIYVQDHTGAITLHLLNSGGFYQGDSIRLYLVGCVLSPYNGLLQLDSVDVNNNVVKQATDVYVAPTPTTLSALLTQTGLTGNLQSKLISLSGVEFVDSTGTLTYSDPVGQTTVNRNIQDCNGVGAVVRTSGYADFAGQHLPTGKGTFIGIASYFGSAAQLYIRDINEVQMNGPRCGSGGGCTPANSLSEDFSSVSNNMDVSLDCWTNVFTMGSRKWRGKVVGSDFYAEASTVSFDSGNEMWLVTPSLVYSSNMNLSFSSAKANWVHDGLTVWVSTNFNGSNVATANWTQVTGASIAGQADADGAWVNSGSIGLSSFLPSGYTGNFVVGFKYTGNSQTNQTTTYRIDNVEVN